MYIYTVDAFAERPFTGNPAGVCLLDSAQEESWMQNVAMEMNQAETAFLVLAEDGYNLRWFTPVAEVDLCGHATLASAHILWETGVLAEGKTARFHTKSGLLTAVKQGDWIQMDFPAEPDAPCETPAGLAEALGVPLLYVGKNRMDYIVEIESEEALKTLTPDSRALAKLGGRGIIVTAASREFDFVSRCFFPAVGIDEDPVTGSAHCCLGPYWSRKLNKNTFTACQESSRRGIVKVEVRGPRVNLSGKAFTVLKAELMV